MQRGTRSTSSATRRIRLLAASLLGLFGSSLALAENHYSEVISFGDSISDVGTYRVGLIKQLGGGRFTTNPGPIWVERVGEELGTQVTPFRVGYAGQSIVLGGTGYAEGGARVSQQPGVNCNPNSAGVCTAELARPVSQQIDDFLAYNGHFGRHQLVFVQAGGNDLLWQLALLGAGAEPVSVAAGAMQQAAIDLATQVQRIEANGDATVVVLNLPDVALTPFARSQSAGVQALVSGLVQVFNGTLAAMLIGNPATLLDAYSEWDKIAADPVAFGVKNLNVPACDPNKVAALTGGRVVDAWALVCTDDTLVEPDAAHTYLYADDVHPTRRGHEIIARFVLQSLHKRGVL
jgi:phospholipase/lecithinase/hemolysin